MTSVSILLLLFACVGPPLPVEPSCPHSVHRWFGEVTRHLHQAEGGGAFEVVPGEPWIASSRGVWDRHGCSFVAHTLYVEGYFLVGSRTWGAGRLEADGDYQLSWGREIEDALGNLEQARVVESRQGCRISSQVALEGEQVTTVAEIVDESTVQGLITGTRSEFDVTATWRADFSAALSYAGHDGESWYEVEEPGDGTRSATFHLAYDGGREDGGYERSLDGTREYLFDRFPEGGEWSVMHIWWLLHYDGSGQGEVVGEALDGTTLTCWYEWDSEGVGSYLCDDGTSGPY